MDREKLLEKNKITNFKNIRIDFKKILQIYLYMKIKYFHIKITRNLKKHNPNK